MRNMKCCFLRSKDRSSRRTKSRTAQGMSKHIFGSKRLHRMSEITVNVDHPHVDQCTVLMGCLGFHICDVRLVEANIGICCNSFNSEG